MPELVSFFEQSAAVIVVICLLSFIWHINYYEDFTFAYLSLRQIEEQRQKTALL